MTVFFENKLRYSRERALLSYVIGFMRLQHPPEFNIKMQYTAVLIQRPVQGHIRRCAPTGHEEKTDNRALQSV